MQRLQASRSSQSVQGWCVLQVCNASILNCIPSLGYPILLTHQCFSNAGRSFSLTARTSHHWIATHQPLRRFMVHSTTEMSVDRSLLEPLELVHRPPATRGGRPHPTKGWFESMSINRLIALAKTMYRYAEIIRDIYEEHSWKVCKYTGVIRCIIHLRVEIGLSYAIFHRYLCS